MGLVQDWFELSLTSTRTFKSKLKQESQGLLDFIKANYLICFISGLTLRLANSYSVLLVV